MLQLINREDYSGRDHNEVMAEFQKIVDAYGDDIKDMTLEQCKEEEKRLIAIMDEHDKNMLGVEYELPKTCKLMGSASSITRKAIGGYICELLDKVECEYQYTLGYFQLYQWWKNPQDKISYNNLNSTLQVLGNNMRFRGSHQWQMILSINEYFKPLHNAYIIDNMLTHLYGACHSKLLDKMKIDNPIAPDNAPAPEAPAPEAPEAPSFEESQGEAAQEQ